MTESTAGPDPKLDGPVRTIWTDKSWMSTVHRPDRGYYETVFFAPDAARSCWRLNRVFAATGEDALHNHDQMVSIVDDDNTRVGRRARHVGADAPRCPAEEQQKADPSLAPWVEPTTVSDVYTRLGFYQPWVSPDRTSLRRSDPYELEDAARAGSRRDEPASDTPRNGRPAGLRTPLFDAALEARRAEQTAGRRSLTERMGRLWPGQGSAAPGRGIGR